MVALACYGSDDQRDLDRLETGGERGQDMREDATQNVTERTRITFAVRVVKDKQTR